MKFSKVVKAYSRYFHIAFFCALFFSTSLFAKIQTDDDKDKTFRSGIINPEQFSHLLPEKYIADPKELSQEDLAAAKEFLSIPTQHVLEVMYLAREHFYRVVEEQKRLGLEEMIKKAQKRQNSDSIEFEVPGVGKAEPLVYQNGDQTLLFTKIRHNGLKRIFFFIDIDQAKLDLIEQAPNPNLSKEAYAEELRERRAISSYIRKLTARMILAEWNANLYYKPISQAMNQASLPENVQTTIREIMHADAEVLESRSWFQNLKKKAADITLQIESEAGMKAGWDVMLVAYSSLKREIVANQITENPKVFRNRGSLGKNISGTVADTYHKWSMYWSDIWDPPAYNEKLWRESKGIAKFKVAFTGDYLNGLGQGVFLGALSVATMTLFSSALPGTLDPMSVGMNSFAFSVFFGVFTKSWQRVIYKGGEFARFVKNSLPGLVQSYSMFMMGGVNLAPMSNGELDLEAMSRHGDVAINQSIKSRAKDGLQELPRFRAQHGEAQGTIKILLPKISLPFTKDLPFFSYEFEEKELRTADLTNPNYDWSQPNLMEHISEVDKNKEDFPSLKYKVSKIKLPWISMREIDTHIPRVSFEAQLVQLYTTPIGLLSRFGYSVVGIPVGHLLYSLMSPYGRHRALIHKEHYLSEISEKMGANHPQVERVRIEIEQNRAKWDSLRLFNLPYTNYLGFYFKEVPSLVWEVAKTVGNWAGKHMMYNSYRFYRAADNAINEIEEQRLTTEEVTGRMNRLFLVRTEDGSPHPEQLRIEELRIERANKALNYQCQALF